MKFAEHLSAHVTPEWNSQYIRYDDMKELLAQALAKAQPFADESDNALREQFFVRVDEHFFQVKTFAGGSRQSERIVFSIAKRKRRKSIHSLLRSSRSK